LKLIPASELGDHFVGIAACAAILHVVDGTLNRCDALFKLFRSEILQSP
jgi:hypothetical protein